MMGVDACIYFEDKQDLSSGNIWVPNGCDIISADSYHKKSGATHEVKTSYHYYGIGYERGPWHLICGILIQLFASEDVDKVWYFGDHSLIEETEPITIDKVLEISRHYMLNGHRPYRKDW